MTGGWRRGVLVALLAAAVVGVVWQRAAIEPSAVEGAPLRRGMPTGAPSAPLGTASEPAALAADPRVAFERWIHERSSLRGSELDGAWGSLDAQGRLEPSLAVRQRFDQLLTLQGETSIEQITAFVEQGASEALGLAGTAQLMDLWRRYLGLIGERVSVPIDLADAQTWPLALADRRAARRAALGPAWAEAFYGAEEREFEALMQQRGGAQAAARPASGLALQDLAPAARRRVEDERRAWQDWETRLARARVEWNRLRADAQLSEIARRSAIDAWVAERFDRAEQPRVRALLKLPRAPVTE
ncbi:MAG TPA: hypothetical protein VLI72_18000 [Methylibium sp.]|nr:hypothetical protein [Methylibium sp.]